MRTPMGPGSVRGGLPGAGATPLRDQLSINAAEDATTLAVYGSGSTLQERLRQKALRQELRAGLASLPEPQYTYEVVLPDAEEDAATETGTGSAFREDAADIDRRNAEAEAAAEAAAFERRSSALKREPALPRVTTIDDDVFVGVSKAESLISAELVELLHHDAVKFPVKAKPSRKVAPVLDAFSDAELASARAMVAQETTAVQAEFAAKCGGTLPSASQLYSLWQQMFDSHVFVPSLKAFAPQSVLTPEQVVEANRAEFDKLLHKLERDSKRVAKSEEKLTLITAGFEKRASAAVDDIRKFSAELEEKWGELSCLLVSPLCVTPPLCCAVSQDDFVGVLQAVACGRAECGASAAGHPHRGAARCSVARNGIASDVCSAGCRVRRREVWAHEAF